jgi:hypothetical protein
LAPDEWGTRQDCSRHVQLGGWGLVLRHIGTWLFHSPKSHKLGAGLLLALGAVKDERNEPVSLNRWAVKTKETLMKRVQYKRYALGLVSILTLAFAMNLTSGSAYACKKPPVCEDRQIEESETAVVVGSECGSREVMQEESEQCGDATAIAFIDCSDHCSFQGCRRESFDTTVSPDCRQGEISIPGGAIAIAAVECVVTANCDCE